MGERHLNSLFAIFGFDKHKPFSGKHFFDQFTVVQNIIDNQYRRGLKYGSVTVIGYSLQWSIFDKQH